MPHSDEHHHVADLIDTVTALALVHWSASTLHRHARNGRLTRYGTKGHRLWSRRELLAVAGMIAND